MKKYIIISILSILLIATPAHAQSDPGQQGSGATCPSGYIAIVKPPLTGFEYLQGKSLTQEEAALLRNRLTALAQIPAPTRCVQVLDQNSQSSSR